MSLNGSGVFVVNSAGQPVVANTLITSAAFNAYTADVATALSTAIFKDGQQTVTANIPFGNFKLTGVGAATARTDAATLATIQDGTGVYVATVGGTADAITLTPSPAITAYSAGQTFWFLASGNNTTAVTMTVSGIGGGAKAVKKNGTTALVAGDIASGAMTGIRYDGTNFQLVGAGLATVTPGAQPMATLTTAGDLYVATASATVARQGVGSDGYRLIPSSGATNKMAWTGPGFEIVNGYLTVSVGSNAVTAALKGADGNDPSATNPVSVVFRNATAGTGTPTILLVTGSTSVVGSSGSTFGTVSGQASRIYITGHNDGGTFRLGFYNPLSGTSVLALDDAILYSSTAEGGAGGADSAQVIYTGSAVTTKALRILGYFESTQATAGTWATTPSKVQPMGFGVSRPGDVVQTVYTQTGAVATGTTDCINDDSIPLASEGDQYMSLAITAMSALNLVRVESRAVFAASTTTVLIMTLFQDGGTGLATVATQLATNGDMYNIGLMYRGLIGTASSSTFTIRAGGVSTETITFNGTGGNRRFAGVMNSYIEIQEIWI